MKIIDTVKKALTGSVARKPLAFDVEKRNGTYVSRPLLLSNAQKWYDWAVKHGVPNPVAAADMHVTVISTGSEINLALNELPVTVSTSAMWDGGGQFCMLGKDEDALTFCFRSYDLYWRNDAFISAGAVSLFPSYRPHLTLSYDAPDFEMPPEALSDVPAYVIMGAETIQPLKTAEVDAPDDGDGDEGDDIILIVVMEAAAAKAQAMLDADKEKGALSPMDAFALADVTKSKVTRGVAKRLAGIDSMPAEIKALANAEKAVPVVAKVRKRVEKDTTITVKSVPEELAKSMGLATMSKSKEERQIAMGIASISTVEGECTEDLHGDEVTTTALIEFNYDILKGSRASKFEHSGGVEGEVVAGLVLTADWQKALDIDLGYEPYLVEIHVPDPKVWAEVKKGDWELSIAGRMWYYEDEADAV